MLQMGKQRHREGLEGTERGGAKRLEVGRWGREGRGATGGSCAPVWALLTAALCQQSHVSHVADRKLRLGEAASHV